MLARVLRQSPPLRLPARARAPHSRRASRPTPQAPVDLLLLRRHPAARPAPESKEIAALRELQALETSHTEWTAAACYPSQKRATLPPSLKAPRCKSLCYPAAPCAKAIPACLSSLRPPPPSSPRLLA